MNKIKVLTVAVILSLAVAGLAACKGGKATVPSAPQNVTATVGDGQITLSWTAPANDGGSAVTGYQVTKDNWETKAYKSASQLSHTFEGLTNGISYTVRVRAVNAKGEGAEAEKTVAPAAAHAHAYGSDWQYDDDRHWKECGCGDATVPEEHEFDGGAATGTVFEVKYTCFCGYEKTALEYPDVITSSAEWNAVMSGSFNALYGSDRNFRLDYNNSEYQSCYVRINGGYSFFDVEDGSWLRYAKIDGKDTVVEYESGDGGSVYADATGSDWLYGASSWRTNGALEGSELFALSCGNIGLVEFYAMLKAFESRFDDFVYDEGEDVYILTEDTLAERYQLNIIYSDGGWTYFDSGWCLTNTLKIKIADGKVTGITAQYKNAMLTYSAEFALILGGAGDVAGEFAAITPV